MWFDIIRETPKPSTGGSVNLSNYYTKAQIETKLNEKVNTSDLDDIIIDWWTFS